MLAIFALLAVYAGRRIWDIDLFWHVVAGRAFVDAGRLLSQDTFSAIDPDRPWVPLVWGYEVLVALLDQAGGLSLLRLVHAFIQWIAFALLWWGLRRRVGLQALATLLVLALAILLYADRFRERPHVFNLLFECLLIPWLARGPAALDRRAWLATAVIMALWANLHGGGAFVFLLIAAAVPGAAALERLLGLPGAGPRLRAATIWYAAALLPALVAPGFVSGIVHTFGMVEGTEVGIPEWAPSWRYFETGSIPAHYFNGLFPTLVLLAWTFPAARVLGAAVRGREALHRALAELRLHDLALALAFLLFAHRSIRFVYFAAFAVLFTAPALRAVLSEARARAGARTVALQLAALAGILAMTYQHRVLFLYGGLERAVATVFARGEPLDAKRFPVEAADFLEKTGFEGNLFVQARWGGYLLYRLWPRAHVTADGRGNYPESVMLDLWRVAQPKNFADPSTGPDVQAIYERYPVDALVLPHPVWPTGYVPDAARWVPVYADEKGAVWIRRSPVGDAYLKRSASARSGR